MTLRGPRAYLLPLSMAGCTGVVLGLDLGTCTSPVGAATARAALSLIQAFFKGFQGPMGYVCFESHELTRRARLQKPGALTRGRGRAGKPLWGIYTRPVDPILYLMFYYHIILILYMLLLPFRSQNLPRYASLVGQGPYELLFDGGYCAHPAQSYARQGKKTTTTIRSTIYLLRN